MCSFKIIRKFEASKWKNKNKTLPLGLLLLDVETQTSMSALSVVFGVFKLKSSSFV